MARKKYGKYTDEQFRKNLEYFESITGSQKEAAKRLGIDVSTYRAYKTGKREPTKEKASQFNRIYGQNKRKLQDPQIKERIKRREKRVENLRKAREPQKKREQVVVVGSRAWIMEHFKEEYIRQNLLAIAPMFAAYHKSEPEYAQFTDEPSQTGKPIGTKSCTIYGLYTNNYVEERAKQLGEEVSSHQMDLFADKAPLLAGLTEEWDLQRTMDYLEKKFFETTKQVGRRKYNPTQFIGFHI